MPTGFGGGGGSAKPLTWYGQAHFGGGIGINSANQVTVCGFALPYNLTFSNIVNYVWQADGTNLYDVGIYTQAGALVANTGPNHWPSTGFQTLSTLQGAKTLQAGLYLFGFTGNANTGQVSYDSGGSAWAYNVNITSSSGGTLPASIGAVAIAPDYRQFQFHLY